MKKEKTFLLYLSQEDHKQIKVRSSQIGISINQYIYEAICNRWEKEQHFGFPKIELIHDENKQ